MGNPQGFIECAEAEHGNEKTLGEKIVLPGSRGWSVPREDMKQLRILKDIV
tara:strand:+ start:3232 stop:3384 length:153 start_codon:yes stop_codon:yes gene_type:complete